MDYILLPMPLKIYVTDFSVGVLIVSDNLLLILKMDFEFSWRQPFPEPQ